MLTKGMVIRDPGGPLDGYIIAGDANMSLYTLTPATAAAAYAKPLTDDAVARVALEAAFIAGCKFVSRHVQEVAMEAMKEMER